MFDILVNRNGFVFVYLVLWSGFLLHIANINPTVQLPDFFAFIERADGFSIFDLSDWIDGFYPVGYPILLRWAYFVFGDYELAGRFISLVGAVLALYAVYKLSSNMFGWVVASLALLICSNDPTFIQFAGASGTDMPFVGMLLYGVSFINGGDSGVRRFWGLFLAGLFVGLAYLIRYTAIPVVIAIMFWIWIQPKIWVGYKERGLAAVIFLAGFTLAAIPQLLPSTVIMGNPFYNLQGQNVYFGIFGGGNWGLNWGASGAGTDSILKIAINHPAEFLGNFMNNIRERVPRLKLIQYPLYPFVFSGVIYSLNQRYSRATNLLVPLVIALYASAISVAFVAERLLLLLVCFYSIYAAFGLWVLVPKRVPIGEGFYIAFRSMFISSSMFVIFWSGIVGKLRYPISDYDLGRINVSNKLHEIGMVNSEEVLSFSFGYYDVNAPKKNRFSTPWYRPDFQGFNAVNDIVSFMRKEGKIFLLVDSRVINNVKGLDRIWVPDNADINRSFDQVPVAADGAFLYRIK